MSDNPIIKIVYMFFLGLLTAVFVGVGINTFYEGPIEPEYPKTTVVNEKNDVVSQKQQDEYDMASRAYWDAQKIYSRNVSIIVLLIAVILVSASLHYDRRSPIIANGVMLGGLFTLVYGIIRSFMSADSRYIFVAATVGLGLVVYLGYRRFAVTSRPAKKS